MSDKRNMSDRQTRVVGHASPVWWIVFTNELADLWKGGKGLILVTLYAIILGGQTYVFASNSELSLMTPERMVYETLKAAIAMGAFVSLVIGADSISSERERATLEGLLLTPTSRRQLVLGKFLAALSVWPAALVITVPFFSVLAQGGAVFGQALVWGVLLGSVMAAAYTGVGMLVSFWSNSNKTSFFTCLGIYFFFLVPTTLPGAAQAGVTGQFLQWLNPMAASDNFLLNILVNLRTLAEFASWLTMPVVFVVLVVGLVFLYAGPALRLEAGAGRRLWPR